MKRVFGKLEPEFLERTVFRHLGRQDSSVLVGPGTGLDNAVVSIGTGRVLIVTTDPVSIIPSVGMEASAWLSVHLIASDFVTSGVRPSYGLFELNLPDSLGKDEVEAYFRALGRYCGEIGVAIVGGHTGVYPGAGFTVVGGGTMFGEADQEDYVTPAMAEPGDSVLMTKSAAIEAAAVLANSFPKYLEARIGKGEARKARDLLRLCSVVEDALTARAAGGKGVTSMHDATEGGVLGGLQEMAAASKKRFIVESEKVSVYQEARLVCSAFGLDPLTTQSEGTLLLTCRPDATDSITYALKKKGIMSSVIGRVEEGSGLTVVGGGRRSRYRVRDRYWNVYNSALRRGLR